MFERLFTPMCIGPLEIANRFVVAPMHSGFAGTDHRMEEASFAYYAQRAKGGFGLVITEFLCVSKEGLANVTQAGVYDDSFLPGLTRLAETIHAGGAACFAQIHHAGVQNDPDATGQIAVGASGIPVENQLVPVHELSAEEIRAIIEKFGDAAVRAQKAGFDGVEIHGAHGYLIEQFFSAATNKRTDAYGGSTSARAVFACEIIRNIKKKCGETYPVCVRMSVIEGTDAGNTITDSAAQAVLMESAGADAIHVSIGTPVSKTIIMPYYVEPGFNGVNAERIKKAIRIPVICVGRINDPATAEYLIASGMTDFVALGRQSICDPEFPNKVKEGRLEEILHCAACMQRCYGGNTCGEEDAGVSCTLNPFSGKENTWKIVKTRKPKKIVVVGGGPAGLQAAWILAAKGHQVTLLEKEKVLGGQMRIAGVPPKKQDLAGCIATYAAFGRKYGVEIRTGVKADENMIRGLNPDVLIIAIGASPLIPPIPGIDGKNICTAQSVLSGKTILGKKKVLVIGAGIVGCETADFLLSYENQIEIVDMLAEMAPTLSPIPREYLLRRLNDGRVIFHPNARVLAFTEDGIRYTQNGQEEKLDGFDAIVLALGSKPNVWTEYENLERTEVFTIGDADQVVDAKMAIYQATRLAVSLQ